MRYKKEIPLFFHLLLLAPLVAFSQTPYVVKSHAITVDGTSSLHDWTSDVTKIDWSGKLGLEGKTLKTVSDVTMKIDVASIKSSKGGTMDEKTYEAFKYEKYPTITFKLTNATVNGASVKVSGALTMAGVTKPIVMQVAAKVLDDGSVRFTGSQVINMKDYQMTPPKAVMGTIKVGEKVTLLYDLTVVPR